VPWPVHDAKQRFSRLVEAARTQGPQVVTRHGVEVAVVVSIDDYRELGRGSAKDALRAFAEVADDQYASILDEIVAERRFGLPRDLPIEP
jgi:prevent-host-death family protein